MNLPTIITNKLQANFKQAWEKHNIIFFCAPYGTGKKLVCRYLLENHKPFFYYSGKENYQDIEFDHDIDTVVIVDLQLISDKSKTNIYNLVKNNSYLHFVFLSTGCVPGFLMPFSFTGNMHTFSTKDLLIDKETLKSTLANGNTHLQDTEIDTLYNDMHGYPLATSIACKNIIESGKYTEIESTKSLYQFFSHCDSVIFSDFSQSEQNLLITLSLFDQIDIDFAKHITKNPDVWQEISEINKKTSILKEETMSRCSFLEIFQKFLLWKSSQFFSLEQRQELYKTAATYYIENDEITKALDCYIKIQDMDSVFNILEMNARLNPGSGYFHELEEYYFALTDEQVKSSAHMMSALSMLHSLCIDYVPSDKWYNELCAYAEQNKDNLEIYKEAKILILYLDIALPQRASHDIIDIVSKSYPLVASNQIKFPSTSVTSALPSIMNGGKDYSQWSLRDDEIYNAAGKQLELFFDKQGVGMIDCGLCESKFEKGEDISDLLLSLMSILPDIYAKNAYDMEFAAMTILARAQLKEGKAESAKKIITTLREKYQELNEQRYLANIDALLCRINLHLDDEEAVLSWLENEQLSKSVRLRSMWRYRYITKAMVELSLGKNDDAIFTVAPLITYCEKCGRTMDSIYIHTILAICYYRKGDEKWRKLFKVAFDFASEFNFIVPISKFGIAVLPMLKDFREYTDKKYYKKLLDSTRARAINYPRFLRHQKEISEPLSTSEKQVLKLICQNLSNNEIGEILDIKLSTVKTHVSHIMQKLGSSRRSELRDIAKKHHLI